MRQAGRGVESVSVCRFDTHHSLPARVVIVEINAKSQDALLTLALILG
jgi:hypothetical protein